MAEAETSIDEAKSVVEELKDEMQNWLDNLPENLQNGSKADEINDAISELEQIYDALDGIDCNAVSFPAMM